VISEVFGEWRRAGSPCQVEEIERPVSLEAHGTDSRNLEDLLGRFVDVSWAKRFGPPAQDVIALTLESEGAVISRRFAYGLLVEVPGFVPEDDASSVEPGHSRTISFSRVDRAATARGGHLTALNLAGRVPIVAEDVP
jgi:hypothetical protein